MLPSWSRRIGAVGRRSPHGSVVTRYMGQSSFAPVIVGRLNKASGASIGNKSSTLARRKLNGVAPARGACIEELDGLRIIFCSHVSARGAWIEIMDGGKPKCITSAWQFAPARGVD